MPVKKQNTKSKKSVRKPAARRAPAIPVENPPMVSFGRAVVNFFKKYFQFSGTATRAEYWWVFLFVVLCVFAIIFITSIVLAGQFSGPVDIETNMKIRLLALMPVALFYIITIVPWYALMARRLHDVGITARLLWISVIFSAYSVLVPGVVRDMPFMRWLGVMWTLLLFFIFLIPSKTKNNPYRD